MYLSKAYELHIFKQDVLKYILHTYLLRFSLATTKW